MDSGDSQSASDELSCASTLLYSSAISHSDFVEQLQSYVDMVDALLADGVILIILNYF